MKFVNKYLRNFTPYKLASHKIWTVTNEERQQILKLDWNEATIQPSPKVDERVKALVAKGNFYNLYPATYNEELLDLLSKYIELPKENIQYFASSDSLHEYIAKLYITIGDPILILGPSYDNFRLTAEVCGANVFFFDIGTDFCFNENEFCKMIDEKEPSLVYLCNPNNPTGILHNKIFVENLLNKYPQVLFLVDEAYSEFAEYSVKELILQYENILISRTMSKAFALANFRFGYLLASQNNIDYISSIRNPKNITTFAQEAVIGALQDIPYMKEYVKEVNLAKKQFEEDMKNYRNMYSVVHGEGNFLLVRCNEEDLKEKTIKYLKEKNIFVRDVSQTEFLKKYCFRITIGTRKQMKRVMEVIKIFYEEK